MASISSTGVGSGLDVNTIVSSLMAVEKRPLSLLQTRASEIQTRISAFGNLKSQLSALGDVAARLATPASWNPLRVDSSDGASVTATAGTTAQAGTHTLQVDQLAQAQVLASGNFGSSATVVGTGTLTLELGSTTNGVFSAKSGSSPVSITIGSGNQTLAGVRDAINAAKAGVTASIVNGSAGARLVLRGSDGAESSIRLTAADDDGNATDQAGLSQLAFDPAAAAGAGRNLTQSQASQDAKFWLDGVELASATNTPADALEGVTFSLRQVTSEPVSLAIAVETSAVRKNVNDFVNAYNSLNRMVQAQTQADPTGAARGALQADSAAVSLLNAMRTMLHGNVGGMAGTSSLNAAGIELQKDGSLSVNETRFGAAMGNPARLAQLFSQAQSGSDGDSRGIGVRFQQWAQQLTGDGGMLTNRVEGLTHSVELNQKQQDVQQDRLDRTEARLRAQYQRLDSQMSLLTAQLKQMTSALGLS